MNDKLEKINASIDYIEAENEKYIVMESVERYGGSFVKALGLALMRADHENVLKIKKAFPEYWEQYLNFK